MHSTDEARTGFAAICPTCKQKFKSRIKGNGKPQVFCSRSCVRKDDWTRRKRKERIKHTNGYMLRYAPDHPQAINKGLYVLEHRLVMEEILGRRLDPRERVHHKNGVRDDNRPENLELWTLDHKDPPGIRSSEAKHCATCTCHEG